jgi:hypothetical protein
LHVLAGVGAQVQGVTIPWTLQITGLDASKEELDAEIGAIAALLDARGHRSFNLSAQPLAADLAVPLQQPRRRRRRAYIGACPHCGAQAGLHALSCEHYRTAEGEPEPLSDACLAELRSLPPSQWSGWPPDDYDQGLAVVEIRQDHLKALLAEVDVRRRGE